MEASEVSKSVQTYLRIRPVNKPGKLLTLDEESASAIFTVPRDPVGGYVLTEALFQVDGALASCKYYHQRAAVSLTT